MFRLILALSLCAWGQTRVDSGVIAGTVSAQGAKVTLTLDGTDLRSVVSDGEFRFEAVAPGVYSVRVEAAGFETKVADGVIVTLAQTTFLPLDLSIAAVMFTAEVAAKAPVIDFERVAQSTVLDSERIENLPINRRNYLDFALLTPGVVETTNTANAADYRVPVLQNSGLSFSGSNGRGNTFTIDGVENINSTGAVRPSVSQEAVREFVVNRSSYSAELGGGYGGAVNIVTRSGSNDFHGDVFGFLRQTSLEARNYFDFGPSKASFTRSQVGASAGGAVVKNKLFYFAAFERLDRHEATFVPVLENRALLDSLSASQQALVNYLSPSVLGSTLAAVLKPSTNPTVRPLYNNNSGIFPFESDVSQLSMRLDDRLSAGGDLFFRVNMTAQNEQNAQFGALAGYSRGVKDVFRDGTIAAGYQRAWSPRFLSVSRIAIAYTRYTGLPNDPATPEINIAGAGNFGRDSQYPYQRREVHTQFEQTYAFTTARHTVKFGMDLNPMRTGFETVPWNGGRFEFASVLPLALVLNAVTGDSNFANTLGGNLAAAGRFDLAQSLGDPISSLQSYALGLPVAYFQGFGKPHYDTWQQRTSMFVDENWRAGRGLFINAGVRFQGEASEGVRYLRNFSPRLGFTWSPKGTAWVVRGGAGMFSVFNDVLIPYATYGFKPQNNQIVLVPLTGLPYVINPKTHAGVTSADIWQTLSAQGVIGRRSIQYSDLAQLGFTPGFAVPITGDLSHVFRSPTSTQASLEVEHSVGQYTMSAGYQYTRTVHLPRVRDYNLKVIGKQADGMPLFGAVDPAVISNYVIESTGNGWYNAMFVRASRRFRNRWTFDASYTLSRAIDDVTDYGFDFAAQNQFDNSAEKGPSLFHAKNRVLVSAVYDAGRLRNRVLSEWKLSTIFQANSGRPFNVLTGFDNVGDNLTTTHRPIGLGRNVGVGPAFVNADVRLARVFPLPGERVKLEITAEMFNIANHTNFIGVNNVVGATPLSALPRVIQGHRGIPTDPLAFTSAADPREVQFGLKIHF